MSPTIPCTSWLWRWRRARRILQGPMECSIGMIRSRWCARVLCPITRVRSRRTGAGNLAGRIIPDKPGCCRNGSPRLARLRPWRALTWAVTLKLLIANGYASRYRRHCHLGFRLLPAVLHVLQSCDGPEVVARAVRASDPMQRCVAMR